MSRKRGGKKNSAPQLEGTANRGSDPAFFEWVLAALSGLVVAAMVALLVHEAIDGEDGLAHLEAEPISVVASGDRHAVRFRMFNSGDATAAEVEVVATLRDGEGTVVDSARASFDYVPSGSMREGVLLFDRDPAAGELRIAASGYADP